jgi:hypothetical protein
MPSTNTQAQSDREAMQAIAEELENAINEERGIFPRLKIDGKIVRVGAVIQSPVDLTVYGAHGGEWYFSYNRDYAKLLTALVAGTIG